MDMSEAPLIHTTVLLHEAVEALLSGEAGADGTYVDATFGRGGHSRLILSQLSDKGRLVAFDKDPDAIAEAQTLQDARFAIRHEGFCHLGALPAGSVDGVLMDLGVSSPQIDNPVRGFSFRFDGPLDMRMDTTRGQSVAEWLADESGAQFHPPLSWPSSWLTRSKPASRARTLQRGHFRLFGFSSTPSLKSCNKR